MIKKLILIWSVFLIGGCAPILTGTQPDIITPEFIEKPDHFHIREYVESQHLDLDRELELDL